MVLAIALALAVFSASVLAGAVQVSSATYTPTPTGPGKLISVFVTIKNNSNSVADQVSVEPQLNYPFSLSETGRSSLFFDAIPPFQSVSGTLDIQVDKQALNGTYTLSIVAQEEGLAGVAQDVAVQVISFKPQVEIVSSNIPDAVPGQSVQAEIEVRNIGSSNAINILIGTVESLTSTGQIVERPIKNIGPSLVYLDSLSPNESRKVSMTLGVDSTAELKTHLIPFKIRFQDENRSESELTRFLGIRVNASAELDAYFSLESEVLLSPGARSLVTVNLFNRGVSSARNVVAEVLSSDSFTVMSEPQIFIGTLDSDDFDSFAVDLKVNSDLAPGTYPVKVAFEFKNENNENMRVEKEVPLRVFSAQEAAGNGKSSGSVFDWILPLIVIALVVFFVYRRYRNRNSKRK